MFLAYDTLLWLLIAFHVIGAAALFLRLFPKESPWLALLIPPLGLVITLNFIEHLVALPTLVWLLPFTLAGLGWAMRRPGLPWRELRVPGGVFLLAFAFNFAIKCLHPTIGTDDSLADLDRILDFSFGEKLPPTDSWLPPFDHRWYYTFQHYGASVVKRLFALDIGAADNVSFALLNSLSCTAGAGVACLVAGRRAWSAFLAIVLLESGVTGGGPLLLLTMKDFSFRYASDLDNGFNDHKPGFIFHLLSGDSQHYSMPVTPLGTWIWANQYHANLSGFLFTFFAALAGLLVLDKARRNWPWCCLLLVPPLTFLSATWYLPICALLCGSALAAAWLLGRRPESFRFVAVATGLALTLLLPALAALASWPHHEDFGWTEVDSHTPFWIFVLQWWPIYVPWLLLWFFWRRLGAGVRWLHISVGALFFLVEIFNVGGSFRWDTIEKMWGGIFGLGMAGLVPALLVQRNVAARGAAGIIVIAAFLIMGQRLHDAGQWIDWDQGFLHLDGDVYLRTDPQKSRMLQVLDRLHGRTVLAGVCGWNYTEPVGPVVFSMNRCYVAWTFPETICGHGDEANRRSALNNAFYAGTLPHSLDFLNENGIDAVLIAPQDQIPDARLAVFRTELAPDFEYLDCRVGGDENAGVFVRRNLLIAKSR